jgi:hypothetical protein
LSLSAPGPSIHGFSRRRFDSAFGRLQVAVLEACEGEGEWPGRVAAGIRAGLRAAAADLAAARALTVDALAAGGEGARRQQRAIGYCAELLRAAVPEDPRRPPLTERLLIGAIFSSVADRVYAGEAEGIEGIADDLVELVLLHYLGSEDAARLARAPAPA